jgi:hypothetical protein
MMPQGFSGVGCLVAVLFGLLVVSIYVQKYEFTGMAALLLVSIALMIREDYR